MAVLLTQAVIAKEDAHDKLVNVEEFNKTVPVLGGKANEERLRKVIKATVVPKQVARKPLPAEVEKLLTWSEPVNGLAARVEDVSESWRGGTSILVRLKNVSQRPITVPAGNPRDEKSPRPFEIYVQHGSGPWRLAEPGLDCYREEAAADRKVAYFSGGLRSAGKPADRPAIVLKPGEHGLAYVCGIDVQETALAKQFKVIFRQAEAGQQDRWSGVLETSVYSAERLTADQLAALAGAVTMPEHFPAFTYAHTGINSSGHEPAVEALANSNHELWKVLLRYDPVAVRPELERRMRAEKQLPVKLFLAAIAARAGSEEAALLLLEALKSTDYRIRINVHGALALLFPFPRAKPPAWVVELSIAALSDTRFATGLKEARFAPGTVFALASCQADRLEFELCDSKCNEAVPLLIERLRKGLSRPHTVVLLGRMGDKRAIPLLMELVESAGKTARYSERYDFAEGVFTAADALGELKAREAVPLLLKYVEFPEIISAIGDIGDPSAAPILKELVSARGRITRDGKEVSPELAQKRLFAANIALTEFDRANGVDRLGEMLIDQSLSVDERYEVAIYLGRRNDPRVIPYFVKSIKTESRFRPNDLMESRHYLIAMAISDLGSFKCKTAAQGLIECFDVEFRDETLLKGERVTTETYRNHIARSLQAITGQTFGADKQQWLKWWQEKGRQSAELK
jgi:HEAT repeat protein